MKPGILNTLNPAVLVAALCAAVIAPQALAADSATKGFNHKIPRTR